MHVTLQPGAGGRDTAIVTFIAPYRVANALSSYVIAMPSPCHHGDTMVDPIDRDIAGERVRARLPYGFANACGPAVVLEVLYDAGYLIPTLGPPTVLIGQATLDRSRAGRAQARP